MRLVVLAAAVALIGGCRGPSPAAPRRVPVLVEPEIVVSLRGLTLHVFDRTTGASFVYAASAGVLRADGRSVTPVGHFHTGPDPRNSWWYTARRTEPPDFGGMPFVRLTARNWRGDQPYGVHGPTTDGAPLPGYVSLGCVRLAEPDILELFELIGDHPSTPVTIQEEIELDAAGAPVRVGTTPALWPRGVELPFGVSVGPRPDADEG